MLMSFDRIAAVLFGCTGILFMVGSKQLASSSYGSVVGPDIFPFFLGAILVLLSLRLFYETFANAKKQSQEKKDIKRFAIIFVAALIYVITLETIGYVITTFLFLFVSFQVMERSKWLSSLLISACFSGLVYYLYVDILKGTLPGWPIWFT